MEYKYIYLVFSKTNTWLSQLIFMISRMKYTHASISFNKDFTKMYSFGRTNPCNPFSGGFVEENLFEGVYKKSSKCKCLIYKVKITEEQSLSLHRQIERFLSEKNKYRYNFIGLFGVLLNKPLKRENHYFCSQFVSEILINSDVFHSQKIPELIKPNELFAVKNKEFVYEGLLNGHGYLYQIIKAAQAKTPAVSLS